MAPASAGEIYTWTDKNGNIHITDRPPKDSSQVESVIRYSNSPDTKTPTASSLQPNRVDTQQKAKLNKQLRRLKERKTLLEKFIAENQVNIAAAEKEVAIYHKRSGSYARRNEKLIERQMVVLKDNLTTYESDLRYVDEDIVETRQLLETVDQNLQRPGDESDKTAPTK